MQQIEVFGFADIEIDPPQTLRTFRNRDKCTVIIKLGICDNADLFCHLLS